MAAGAGSFGLLEHLEPCLARAMHNRTLVVGFGMVLAAGLLGCPPSAKSAKDSQQSSESEAAPAGDAPAGDASEKKEEKKQQSPAPPPAAGGW
jgi:hypothetical protein